MVQWFQGQKTNSLAKEICKVGAEFANSGEYASSSQSWRVSTSMHSCRWKMNPVLHSRDKTAVQIVDSSRRTGSERADDGEINREGDGHGFWDKLRISTIKKKDE